MHRVKRWTMSVTSWVDGVLAQVENHEAAVSSAIARIRRSTAEARVRLRRVEQDAQKLRDTLDKEEQAVTAWRRRAADTDDEDKALECLRRHRAAERQVATLRGRLTEHERAHKELREGIRRLNGRLSELIERKNVMRARQSRAEAAHGMTSATGSMGDIEDVFDRWESRVGEIEIEIDELESVDPFEEEFESEEERETLRLELQRLREETK